MRAYIEAQDEEFDDYEIRIEIKDGIRLILVGKVECLPRTWLYTHINEDNDLVINCSAGMEANKWDYLTKEIIGDYNE
jgi:hypothetical protein